MSMTTKTPSKSPMTDRALILKARMVQRKAAIQEAIAAGSLQRLADLRRALAEDETEYKHLTT